MTERSSTLIIPPSKRNVVRWMMRSYTRINRCPNHSTWGQVVFKDTKSNRRGKRKSGYSSMALVCGTSIRTGADKEDRPFFLRIKTHGYTSGQIINGLPELWRKYISTPLEEVNATKKDGTVGDIVRTYIKNKARPPKARSL